MFNFTVCLILSPALPRCEEMRMRESWLLFWAADFTQQWGPLTNFHPERVWPPGPHIGCRQHMVTTRSYLASPINYRVMIKDWYKVWLYCDPIFSPGDFASVTWEHRSHCLSNGSHPVVIPCMPKKSTGLKVGSQSYFISLLNCYPVWVPTLARGWHTRPPCVLSLPSIHLFCLPAE